MHHIAQARRNNNARLIVVDPYRTGTAEKAHMHLMLRPGTDGALACAVMHVLFSEGYADREYLHRYTDAPEELEQHLNSRNPAWAARITGLDAAQIVEFARLYGATKRSYIRVGYGFLEVTQRCGKRARRKLLAGGDGGLAAQGRGCPIR